MRLVHIFNSFSNNKGWEVIDMDQKIHDRTDRRFIPITSIKSRTGKEVAKDIYYYTDQIVNIVFIGNPRDDYWFLVDAGMPFAAKEIKRVVENRFGANNKPQAILLTHGHFDHVGGLVDL